MPDELAIWAAGLFDGEGSALISVTGPNYNYLSVVVKITTTDQVISDIISRRWGGRLPAKQDTSKYGLAKHLVWSLEFSRPEALRFLKDIRPYIKTRMQRVDIVMEALEACKVLDDKNDNSASPRMKVTGITIVLNPFYDRLKPYSSDLKKVKHIF